jgi:replicative DNA helicase
MQALKTGGLPQNLEAERLVLGSMMLCHDVYPGAADVLQPDDFSIEKHRRIFRRIGELHKRGEPIDRITVANELMNFSELESCDGVAYLCSLTDGLPQVPNIDAYIRIIRNKAVLRRIIFASEHMMNRCFVGEEPADEILAGAEQTFRKLADGILGGKEPVSTREMIRQEGADGLLAPRARGEIRLPWTTLNEALGGLAGGQMIVLMGETSRGKTSFALQTATHVCQQHKATAVWTMEMSPRALFKRLVTQLSGVPQIRLGQLTFEQRDSQRMAVALLDDDPVYFDRHSRSVAAFCATLRRLQAKTLVGLVVVDYLQLIRSTSRESRAQQVSENSRSLKLAAMDHNVPFLVLSQVDRSSVKGKDARIGLHSAKESGDIENDADVMLWIEAVDLARDQPTPVSIVVGKQREGPAGFPVKMVFQPMSQTFIEAEE